MIVKGVKIRSWALISREGKNSYVDTKPLTLLLLLSCLLINRTDNQAEWNADPDLQVMVKVKAKLGYGSQVLYQLGFFLQVCLRIFSKEALKSPTKF